MATQPKPLDPTAAALSAIEEALNLTPTANDAGTTSDLKIPADPDPAFDRPAPDPKLPKIDETFGAEIPAVKSTSRLPEINDGDLPKLRINEPLAERSATPLQPPRPTAVAANDDQRSVGQILQALQVRPSRAPVVIGFLLAAGWLGLSAFYAFSLWRTGELLSMPQHNLALLGFAAIGPAIFFLVAGTMIRRTQEMRLTARSMTEVAIRLAEPESMATEKVVTLSQAIRREVASMPGAYDSSHEDLRAGDTLHKTHPH